MSQRWITYAAAPLGASGVLLGAFGAHGLARIAPEANIANWRTAVLYHLLHAVVLLILAVVQRNQAADAAPVFGAMQYSASAFVLGVLLFSGSLYLLVLAPATFGAWLGPVTPVGGVLLVAGWLLLLRR